MSVTAPDAPVVHLARPHRPVLVAGTLGELAGPERGRVELPLRLWWNPHRTFDLDQPTMLLWMYENVLREAVRVDELRSYLHGPTLIRIWAELNLPRGVRAAWEARHPALRHAPRPPTTAAGPAQAAPTDGKSARATAGSSTTQTYPGLSAGASAAGMPGSTAAAGPAKTRAHPGPTAGTAATGSSTTQTYPGLPAGTPGATAAVGSSKTRACPGLPAGTVAVAR